LVIAWHLLSDPAAHFTDLGPDRHHRLAPLRRKRQLVAELERLSGKKVILQGHRLTHPFPYPAPLRRMLPPAPLRVQFSIQPAARISLTDFSCCPVSVNAP
jgi:hypothetical protein